jgi:hypothetical protein
MFEIERMAGAAPAIHMTNLHLLKIISPTIERVSVNVDDLFRE